MKIQITNIEHIAWAKRLIITYYLAQNCFNPALGGWEYISDSCGYMNVATSEWIIISPNTQHPAHSSVIQFAGTYTYVWDYGGVEGLDPASFDSEHSYVIALALADHSCTFIDPCAGTGFLTQFGQQPFGVPDTLGDVSNTNNNCGPDYYLRATAAGCLYCEFIPNSPPIDPTEPPPDPFPEPDPAPWDFDNTNFDPIATVTNIPVDGNEGLIFPDGPHPGDIFYPRPIPDPEDGTGGDLPSVVVVSSGPLGPGGDIPGISSTPTEAPLPNSYDYSLGTTAGLGTYGPGSEINSRIKATIYGGRAAGVEQSNFINSMVSEQARDLISLSNASSNARHAADQLNLNPHAMSIVSPSNTINVTSSQDNIRGTTKLVDIININNNDVYLRGKINDTSQVNDVVSINRKNTPTVFAGRDSKLNAIQQVFEERKKISGSPGDRIFSRQVEANFFNLEVAKDTQGFTSNYNFSFYCQDIVRSGDGVFCEAMVVPKIANPYTYTLKLYLKDSTGIKEIATSQTIERLGAITLAKRFPCNASSGTATIIAAVHDSDENVIGVRTKQITIIDAGTRSGAVTGKPTQSASTAENSIEHLVSSTSLYDLCIGPSKYYKELLMSAVPGNSQHIVIACYVIGDNPNNTYALELYKNGILYSRVVGKPTIRGIKPTGSYATAIYLPVIRSEWLDDFKLRISSTNNTVSALTVYVGQDIKVIDVVEASKVYDRNTSTFTFNLTTPFASEELVFYESGGENIVPDSPTLFAFTSDENGLVTGVTVTCASRSWVGVATKEPTDLSLSSRTFYYIRENSNV